MLPQKTSAFLFDYDGVIADSMPSNLLAWQHTFLEFGHRISKDDYYSLEGLNPVNIAITLGTKLGIAQENFPLIAQRKAELYKELVGSTPKIYPGVSGLLHFLRGKKKKIALVTGAGRERIEETTPTDIWACFDVIVSGDDIHKPKPDPESYRIALSKLHIQPSEAIVIENAPLGITSAKRAGCFCIALATTVKPATLQQANMTVSGIKGLHHLLSLQVT